jgi:hypothetical protein
VKEKWQIKRKKDGLWKHKNGLNMPHRPDCTFQSLYRPHIPDNIESWQVFPNDEKIFAFIQNEPFKTKEIISIEDNKIPKGLTPLESLFSSSDVENKEE